jgi:hypothetical protein
MAGINSEGLSALAGIVLSLGFSYIPGISQRFGMLAPTQKRLVMLGLLLACALGVFGLSCMQTGWLSAMTCDQAGAWGLARVFVAAVIANQAAFSVSPRLERTTPAGWLPRNTATQTAAADLAGAGRLDEAQPAPETEVTKRRVRRLPRPGRTSSRPVKSPEESERAAIPDNQNPQGDQ